MFGTRNFFFGLNRFGISSNQTIGRAIDPGFTAKIVDSVVCIVGTGAAARVTDIVGAQFSGVAIYAAGIIVLYIIGTIEMRARGKGSANTDDNCKGH
jgi:hypothetical protein